LQFKGFKGLKRYKWVAIDLNIKFANIDLIKETMGEIEKEEVYVKARR